MHNDDDFAFLSYAVMMILSADNQNKESDIRISKQMLKRFVKDNFGAIITDDAVDELAGILERKAREISKHAVESAKRDNRKRITAEDIELYRLKSD